MGCDKYMQMIMYAEVRENGAWKKVGNIFPSAFIEMNDKLTDRVCDERNIFLYELFGWVTNKLNGYTVINPISELRGLPDDASDAISSNDYFRFGGFTSYLTLEEILNYNWDATISHIGRIPEKSYVNWKKNGTYPARWDRHITGEDKKVITQFVMNGILDGSIQRDDGVKYYVAVEYEPKSYKEYCNFFCSTSLPLLMQLVPNGGSYKDVRVVYTFAA